LQIFERLSLGPVIRVVLQVTEPVALILPIDVFGRFHSLYYSRSLKVWKVVRGERPGQNWRICLKRSAALVVSPRSASAIAASSLRQALNNLVSGRAAISAEMAIRLEKAFGGGSETWLRMRVTYDLAQAEKQGGKIKVRRVKDSLMPA
jgi:addiction module HigA family antidote